MLDVKITDEGNSIIDTFMELSKVDKWNGKGEYHKSWHLLMPVVEKIESIHDSHHGYFGVHISSNSCSIQGTNLHRDIQDSNYGSVYISDPNAILETKIESTWYNVVEFIKWYNEYTAKKKGERNYEKFFTPKSIANLMVTLLEPKKDQWILEPSAGNGRLISAVLEKEQSCKISAFEIQKKYIPNLWNAGATHVLSMDFLLSENVRFDGCIANPPFGNGIDLEAHVKHIMKSVLKGGRIVLIVPDDFLLFVPHTKIPIENWSRNSDGTTTKIKIISFVNP